MRCLLVALGSRGDVAPFLAIGRDLVAAGCEVHLVVLADYAHLAEGTGLVVHAARAGSTEAMWPDSPWLRRAALAQPGVMYALMRRRMDTTGPELARAVLDGAEGCDVLVAGTASRRMLRRLGAARGIPVVTVLMAPLRPASRPERGVLVPRFGGPVVARAVSTVMWAMTGGLGSSPDRAVRALLGSGSPTRAADETLVCATSRTLADGAADAGWIDTGPATPTPLDAGLLAFLDEHPNAVLMGFGSCPSADPRADVALFQRVARRLGRPLVLQTPLLPGGAVDATTFNAPGADHRLLLPRVAAVVHHGGAGTTLTTLAAGTPAVVVPHLGDQAWHARRVDDLGAGVAAPPRWRLTATALERCLRGALEGSVADRAAALAPVVTSEGGGAAEVADRIVAAARR